MNKITPFFLIVIVSVFFSSCKKTRLPLVTTSSYQGGISNARVAGVLYDEGDSKVSEKGICWATHADVSISDNKVTSSESGPAFSVEITGLDTTKTYFAKAYAINKQGISYGKEIAFSTLSSILPSLTLLPAYGSPGDTSATVYLNLNQQTKSTYTVGVCWSTSTMPTVSNSTVMVTQITQSNYVPFINAYNPTLHNLTPATLYYVRAFCTNGLSLSYSNQITITTSNLINIFNLNSVSINNAVVSSSVTGNVANITAVGVCWSSLSQLPTTANTKVEQTYSGTNNFTTYLSALNAGTTYYMRAYIKTASATYYSTVKALRTYKGTATDASGNTYYTTLIGTKEWMTSNLKTSRYNTGPYLQYVSSSQWVNYTNSSTAVYGYYNNDGSYDYDYGKWYPGYFALGSFSNPTGFHIATVAEWQTLLAGNPLEDLWVSSSSSSFYGNFTHLSLDAGGKCENGVYQDMGQKAYFWAAPSTGTDNTIVVSPTSTLVTYSSTKNGYNVRFVKN